VIFNDGTAADLLSNLKGCTRKMHLHEADVTLKSLGLMLNSPPDKQQQVKPTVTNQHRTNVNGSTTNKFKVADMTTVQQLVARMEKQVQLVHNKNMKKQNRQRRKNQARIKIKQQ
jgi:hypothetical protein